MTEGTTTSTATALQSFAVTATLEEEGHQTPAGGTRVDAARTFHFIRTGTATLARRNRPLGS